ncbi:Beta-lactamase-like protein sdnR [Fulvia fulva]|uniref:Beta-lactamase-like protein sdnR n=1 Tax=Passalora fulva TaxID=5499 RepID=A0A9Q8P7D2_PASFU|nr:Beta-lactamase-like protein sdnR [Fulvia fulva]KAK4626669.1 Beta-lactamase-like protein sdnR [Fulvia fulva]KAK4627605.1 Beta-lactamase-like protein sdnR [Fulvia fulva]UJO16020.1 Beta-lactamase-like protein sdnR [Fulvia fulva]WPV13620.1 Beta-lactamase-like protein sdnR [Fulvia fulva]WPV28105.1 Beta-lactamase-like protein sdnR [Fulvia fulva]
MTPDTFNGDLNQGVGKPWEIYRTTQLTNRTLDLYTKAGDLFAHSSNLVLSPHYNVGFVVLAAGDNTNNTVRLISDILIEGLFPALVSAARAQAERKYAGHYQSADMERLNSSTTLTTKAGEPGLVVKSWISNSTDVKSVLSVTNSSARDIRLYPTGLLESSGNGTERVAYRATFGSVSDDAVSKGVTSGACTTWFTQN